MSLAIVRISIRQYGGSLSDNQHIQLYIAARHSNRQVKDAATGRHNCELLQVARIADSSASNDLNLKIVFVIHAIDPVAQQAVTGGYG